MTNEPQRTSAGTLPAHEKNIERQEEWFSAQSSCELETSATEIFQELANQARLAGKANNRFSCQALMQVVYLAKALRHPVTVQILLALCALRLPNLSFESFWAMKAYSVYLFAFIAFCLLQSGK